MNEAKKVINQKRQNNKRKGKGNVNSKGKGKGNDWIKKTPQEAAGHNSEPPKQTYYCGSGLLRDYPLEKMVEWCFLIGF